MISILIGPRSLAAPLVVGLFLVLAGGPLAAQQAMAAPAKRVWEVEEITLTAAREYANPYTDVLPWVQLEGPNFSKRVYGFWDGGSTYRVRVVATEPGEWRWSSGSDQPEDSGLNGRSGSFTAVAWTEAEKRANPVRRGFLRSTPNGRALQYADGTPYFMVGDTWLAGTTWRLPFRGVPAPAAYVPGPGIGFEDAVAYRKRQGYNSVSMIAAFPNWEADYNPSTFANEDGIFLRNAWEKFGYDVAGAQGIDASGGLAYWGSFTAKDMRDEHGNTPFEPSARPGVSDFDRVNPAYFQSLDRKMQHLAEEGFVPLLETVRRDVGPSWNAYFDFNRSFARFVQYIASRYGAYNFVYSVLHLDWIPRDFSLTADQFNDALKYHLETYGPMPFGQPVTVLIDSTTYVAFGHGDDVPWLTMHSVGNKPRDHRVTHTLEEIWRLDPPYPAINFEPYYTGWHHEINMPAGERPEANSERDNYFARAQMYGSVLSGGLSGHVHGTAAYDITTTGEPAGARPHIWDALRYESGGYMRHLAAFVLSEGAAYQQLDLARADVRPHEAPGSPPNGLDGWSYMMRTPAKDFALLYFENGARRPTLHDFSPGTTYAFQWFDPVTGEWGEVVSLRADRNGTLRIPEFPPVTGRTMRDWAAKIVAR